ncbi:RsiV family protein [Domibacillus indicus]|uniref:RsiV family protein n=1 Tax=Domibacillus indicus TaxID=1437523 RepID=UPI0018CED255|nr:DUF3298 domain-containing protein [Domibacillus indicus]
MKVQNYVYKAREKQYGKEINTFGSIYIDSKTPFVYADGGIFQEYEIGPYAIGHPIIHIPFSVYK